MKNCLIYCRVSTEEQAEKGYSLDAQEKLCRDFAQRGNYRIVGVYREEGKSGTNLDRPALQELLSKCTKDSQIDAVIIQETDRLARNTRDHLTIKAVLKKGGARLISVAQPMLDDSPEGMMIDTILASVNQFQSDLNSRKTKRGMQERFDQGLWPAMAPLGYINTLALDQSSKIIGRDKERWELIRHGFELYLTGEHSVAEVNDILFDKGLRSKQGKQIAHSIMASTLKNPFYAGVMRWDGQERTGAHEPMITLEEHRRILQIMDANNLHACRRRKHRFLLRGFMFCNICGHRYTADTHPRKKKSYYHCAARRVHSNRYQHVSVSVLEREVEKQFKTLQFSDEFTKRVIDKLRIVHSEQKEEMNSQKHTLYNQKKAIEAKRDKAEEKLLVGVIEDEDFTRLRVKFTAELARIQEQLEELDRKRNIETDFIQEMLRLSQDIREAYMKAPYELKRQYLGLFWNRFLVQNGRIIQAIPTKLMLTLQRERKVMIRDGWYPSPALIMTIFDWKYISKLQEKFNDIIAQQKSEVQIGKDQIAA